MDFTGKRVTIVGLAREGTALARFLAGRGAEVVVSDQKNPAQLAPVLAQLEGLPVRLSLGSNRMEDLLEADVVFVSPGVPRDLPVLAAAAEHGVPLSSETALFFQLCRAPIVGITGSSGKTTTTTLVGRMLAAAGRTVHVGGNIGRPLIERVEAIGPDDLVVLELSSFQLEALRQSPHVAAITNITPNHLDRHPSMEHYAEAKRNIVRFQRPEDLTILNLDDPGSRQSARARGPGRDPVHWFSRRELVDRGACLSGEYVVLCANGQQRLVCGVDEIVLPGLHNLENVLAAAAAVAACGVGPGPIAQVARAFRGVEHRLELVRERGEVRYYNDSIATAPERTIAALRALDRPIVLLAGGRDKHLPLEDLADLVCGRCRAVVLYGEAAPLLEAAIAAAGERAGASPELVRVQHLAEAVEAAAARARPGDAVLLSPACTSYDQFADFEERGRSFKQLVGGLG